MSSLHPDISERFSELYDDELSPDERRRVEDHLASCATCRDEYAAFRRSLELLHRLDSSLAPSDFVREVTTSINRQTHGNFFNERWVFGVRIHYEVFIALLLVMVSALYLMGQEGRFVVTDIPEVTVESLYGHKAEPLNAALGSAAPVLDAVLPANTELPRLTRQLRDAGFVVATDVSSGKPALVVELPASRGDELLSLIPELPGESIRTALLDRASIQVRLFLE